MSQLLIVADDFTGALDTSVQFSKQGYRTSVTTVYPPDPAAFSGDVDVLVADTESRHLSPGDAYERTFRWIALAREKNVRLIYKKTDSTLRGNVGAELKAALDGSGRSRIIFAPALPRLGRTVFRGEVYMQGAPLTETMFARDPFTPVCSSSLADIIHATAPELRVLSATPSTLLDVYCGAGENAVIVVDAQTDAQLHEIALSSYALREDVVLAGCAGFAQMMPAMLECSTVPVPSRPEAEACLLISGSVNRVALEQVEQAQRQAIPAVLLQPRQLLEPGYWESDEGRIALQKLSAVLQEKRCLILKTAEAGEETADVRHYARTHDIPLEALHLRIADHLGLLTAKLVKMNDLRLISVFGGDTLYGVLKHLEVHKITPESEILPGVVQSVCSCDGGLRYVVSKAGSFGDRDLIHQLLQYYHICPEKAAAAVI